jgi:hypothetical protein
MAVMRRLTLALKAARQLGLRQAAWYALYQAGLRSGLWRALTPLGEYEPLAMPVEPLFALPDPAVLAEVIGQQAPALLAEAGEIVAGRFRPYGAAPAPIHLASTGPRLHWTAAERSLAPGEDIKDTWEPARFGWVYPLGRAYRLTGREQYAAAFWQHFETFLQANPPNHGLHWTSAQEVALRLMALVFAAQVFAPSTQFSPTRMALLAGALAAHAERIPPTLSYAHAQHNNHLVSEGLGLLLAGTALPALPQAVTWQKLGRRTLETALRRQIRPDGVYAQHSLNYHRLMLQAALLAARALPDPENDSSSPQPFSSAGRARLAAAARWLLAQVDPDSGLAPNYGHNDGAYILPLAGGGFGDQRPTAQAAARAFLGRAAFPPGPWDELGLWLGIPMNPQQSLTAQESSPAIHRLGDGRSWAILRAEHYTSRPAHADQLHVDLWWHGQPVTLDAGSYRYNAAPTWDNALAATRVHNTVEVAGQDQMQRAGRFLWLDWAQARLLEASPERLSAEHDGYRRLGITHRRTVTRLSPDRWQVVDMLTQAGSTTGPLTFRLHWLLPDRPYTLEGHSLRLDLPAGRVTLHLSILEPAESPFSISFIRAGQALAGPPPDSPLLGWVSPTYSVKTPALSLVLMVEAQPPLRLASEFLFDF